MMVLTLLIATGKADVIHVASPLESLVDFGIDNADQLSAGIKETAAGPTGVDRRAGLQQGHVVARRSLPGAPAR